MYISSFVSYSGNPVVFARVTLEWKCLNTNITRFLHQQSSILGQQTLPPEVQGPWRRQNHPTCWSQSVVELSGVMWYGQAFTSCRHVDLECEAYIYIMLTCRLEGWCAIDTSCRLIDHEGDPWGWYTTCRHDLKIAYHPAGLELINKVI